MANRITNADIIKINTIYLECKTKAETARRCGFSAGTVSKYIIPNFQIPSQIAITEIIIPEIDLSVFQGSCWNDLILLTDEEQEDMVVLRKEVSL